MESAILWKHYSHVWISFYPWGKCRLWLDLANCCLGKCLLWIYCSIIPTGINVKTRFNHCDWSLLKNNPIYHGLNNIKRLTFWGSVLFDARKHWKKTIAVGRISYHVNKDILKQLTFESSSMHYRVLLVALPKYANVFNTHSANTNFVFIQTWTDISFIIKIRGTSGNT